MEATGSNRSVMAALYRALEELCNGSWSAVRVACVPNGTEHRFVVRIEPEWRSTVYTYLAEHSPIQIPPDGGALNLSAQEAKLLSVAAASPATLPERAPRRMSTDIRGETLRHTFQP